jgi:two-component system, cell cycle response regulator CpdR
LFEAKSLPEWLVSKNILLIEDDKDLMELFVEALIGNDYSVNGFSDPLEALQIFEQNPYKYDLVLSDIRMPGLTGIDLVKKMKKLNPGTNVALMTAFEVSEFETEMRELEFNNFMKKPIHIEQLLNVVKLCLEKKRA